MSMTAPAHFLKWDDETNSADFVISTAAVDRDGDTLDMDGVDLSEYKANPVVLLNHDDDEMAVGVSEDPKTGELAIRKEEVNGTPRLVARCYFNMHDPRSANVARAVKNGFMRAASVSFDTMGDSKRNGAGGHHHQRWKMIEWSIVTIPANAQAVRQVRQLCKSLGLRAPDDEEAALLELAFELQAMRERYATMRAALEALRW